MAGDKKDRLVNLIERKAFRPVLQASADRYDSEADRRRLEDAQAATRRTMERYEKDYTSAQDVYNQFRSDLTSDEAKEVERELRRLDLPTLRDIEPEVEQEAERIGIR